MQSDSAFGPFFKVTYRLVKASKRHKGYFCDQMLPMILMPTGNGRMMPPVP